VCVLEIGLDKVFHHRRFLLLLRCLLIRALLRAQGTAAAAAAAIVLFNGSFVISNTFIFFNWERDGQSVNMSVRRFHPRRQETMGSGQKYRTNIGPT
jgi:hypothetical protein